MVASALGRRCLFPHLQLGLFFPVPIRVLDTTERLTEIEDLPFELQYITLVILEPFTYLRLSGNRAQRFVTGN